MTTRSEHPGDRDQKIAAAIYKLIGIRLQYMTVAVADLIRNELHEVSDLPRVDFFTLQRQYEEIAQEWLAETVRSDGLVPILALARFAAFINADRSLVDLISDNATIVGDERDAHHTGQALGVVIRWLNERDQESQRQALTRRAGAA